jgi:hypothetical protein
MILNKTSFILVGLAALPLVGGCGSRKVMATKQADLVIPADLAKAFEVKDFSKANAAVPATGSVAQTAASDAGVQTPKQKKSRARKKKAKEVTKDQTVRPNASNFDIPNRRPTTDPLWVGERIEMDVTWLGTKAGEFFLEVLPFKEINDRKVYDLKGTAKTSDIFSVVYKAEDWVESFVDYEGWFPYKFILHGDESKHVRDNVELFDHGAKKQYVHTHDNRLQKNEIVEEKGFKDLTPLSQDALSALYYMRTQKFYEGAVIHFPMTTNGSQWETSVTVVAREEVQTKMGYLKAFKTKVETRFKGVLQQQGDAFFWFSDDDRKFPLRFEAKVRIGWITGVAKKIELGTPEHSDTPTPNAVKDPTKSSGIKKPITLQSLGAPTDEPPAIVIRKAAQQKAEAEAAAAPPQKRRRMWFHQLIESIGSAIEKRELRPDEKLTSKKPE